jgi:branched-chain amino acid transport system permease protein
LDLDQEKERFMDLSTALAGAISGLLLGGFYVVTALGLSMVFGVMRFVNLIHGDLLILAAYLNFVLSLSLGVDPLVAAFLLTPVLFLIGYPLQRWVFNPLMHQGEAPALLAAFGMSILIQNILLLIWNADTRTLNTGYATLGFQLFGLRVSLMYCLAFVLSFVLILGIRLFIQRSFLGRAIRAAAQDPTTAQVMGINPKAVYALTYGIGAATSALGGALIGLTFSFAPTSGLAWLLKSFVVVVMGGMGSIGGTLIAGLLFGIAQGVGGALVGTGYADIIGYLIFLLILIFRPKGLFAYTRRIG